MSKIMVVDDSMMVRNQVSRALTGAGFAVVEAVEGEDALKKLGATPDTKLVVCDVNMPKMNGIELLEAAAAKYPNVAFLMLTTEGQPALIQKAKALGAKAWMVKPFKADLLVAAVKSLTA
jgi:two-component system chemotaxis response regulator CheY